ncbi:Tim17/Tim22/Tim23/Pmp24 family protein [Nitzschia inconspicua]|uniref:Mitochondrial import inner membrane translocase subunit TIM22 n=1 Tax=Nitzschia inconspicua TaxID=303405 RepID=A0A9K3LSW6_9STRA|nr:Tim17/Tim22/Tim23/Pmp24 family protein [Nitzschia inconspicua]
MVSTPPPFIPPGIPPPSLPEDQNLSGISSLQPTSTSSLPQQPQPVSVINPRLSPPGTPKSVFEMIMTGQPLTSNHYTPENALHRPVPSTGDRNKNSEYALDTITRKSLPFFQPWVPTAGPSQLPPDFSWLSNSCGGKAAIGVFGGGIMGLLMGVFLGALSDATPPIQVIAGKDVPQAPLKEQMRVTMRATWEKSLYWCRNFAFITGVFGGSECLVEKYRGKHDMWNPVASGCITGAALQAKSGPQAAAVGCAGFAAFSIVIDSFMGHY